MLNGPTDVGLAQAGLPRLLGHRGRQAGAVRRSRSLISAGWLMTMSTASAGGDASPPMTEQAATEQACHGAGADKAGGGTRRGAATNRDLWPDHRRGRHGRRSLGLVLARGGGPGGEEQDELGHGEDENQ